MPVQRIPSEQSFAAKVKWNYWAVRDAYTLNPELPSLNTLSQTIAATDGFKPCSVDQVERACTRYGWREERERLQKVRSRFDAEARAAAGLELADRLNRGVAAPQEVAVAKHAEQRALSAMEIEAEQHRIQIDQIRVARALLERVENAFDDVDRLPMKQLYAKDGTCLGDDEHGTLESKISAIKSLAMTLTHIASVQRKAAGLDKPAPHLTQINVDARQTETVELQDKFNSEVGRLQEILAASPQHVLPSSIVDIPPRSNPYGKTEEKPPVIEYAETRVVLRRSDNFTDYHEGTRKWREFDDGRVVELHSWVRGDETGDSTAAR